jgi:hypothetical protein
LYLNARAIVHVTQAEFLIPGMKKALPGLASFNQVKSFCLFFPQLIFVFAENSDAFDQHQIICEDSQSLITLWLSSFLRHKAAFLPRLAFPLPNRMKYTQLFSAILSSVLHSKNSCL